jgi:carboxypeptidase Taq
MNDETMSGDSKKKLNRLKELDREAEILSGIIQLLSWDQETGMPEKAVAGRSEQISLLEGQLHDITSGKEMGELIEALSGVQPEGEAKGETEGETEGRDTPFLRMIRRRYRRASALPRKLVTDFAREQSRSQAAWIKAREASSFDAFRPHLETLLTLNREKADALGWEDDRYDALLDEFEPWMKSSTVDRLFDEMSDALVSLLGKIKEKKAPEDAFLFKAYDVEKQKRFSRQVAQAIGYDFSRGNISESAHPFTIRPGDDDVRITTRYNEGAFKTAIFGTIHETGHALYEQGVAPELTGTILGTGTSLGIHESQSRTWENVIGRSRPFWTHFYPELQKLFPENLSQVSLESYLGAINRVEPSLIRIEADEVTYGLHIILRFRLERKMLSGDLALNDLPGAWNDMSEELLGIRPGRDADGVLQDVHWSMGAMGYFPTYALGNLYGAQIFDVLQKEMPDLDEKLSSGEFLPILSWLQDRIYRYGSSKTAEELVTGISGTSLSAKPFADYLEEKYTRLYGL